MYPFSALETKVSNSGGGGKTVCRMDLRVLSKKCRYVFGACELVDRAICHFALRNRGCWYAGGRVSWTSRGHFAGKGMRGLSRR